jgi:hypothetical protein
MIVGALVGSISSSKRATPAVLALDGAMEFYGYTTSNLVFSNNSHYRFGTGDFTIEWFQYQTDSNAFPRIFSMGTYPSATIGVSIESNSFYFWEGGSARYISSISNYKNHWEHFAITRSGTTMRVFREGTLIGSRTSTYNFNDSSNTLRIGNESNVSSGAAYGGFLTNFHWVVGVAKYTSAFTPPLSPIPALPESEILLLATDEANVSTNSAPHGHAPTNNVVTWSAFDPTTMPPP